MCRAYCSAGPSHPQRCLSVQVTEGPWHSRAGKDSASEELGIPSGGEDTRTLRRRGHGIVALLVPRTPRGDQSQGQRGGWLGVLLDFSWGLAGGTAGLGPWQGFSEAVTLRAAQGLCGHERPWSPDHVSAPKRPT